MEMLYVLAMLFGLMASAYCDKTLMLENTTYVNIMTSGMMRISKQMDLRDDMNILSVEPKMPIEKNDAARFRETNIPLESFTLGDETTGTEDVASKHVVGTMSGFKGGTLTLSVDIFTAAGNLTMSDNVTMVMKGDVQVKLKLAGYNFNDSSTMLEMGFIIGGPSIASVPSRDTTTGGYSLDLGGNGMIKLPEMGMVGTGYVSVMPTVKNKMLVILFKKSSENAYEYSFVLKPADVKHAKSDPSSCTRVISLGVPGLLLTTLHILLW